MLSADSRRCQRGRTRLQCEEKNKTFVPFDQGRSVRPRGMPSPRCDGGGGMRPLHPSRTGGCHCPDGTGKCHHLSLSAGDVAADGPALALGLDRPPAQDTQPTHSPWPAPTPQAAGCHRGRGRAHSAPSCGQAQIQHNPGALRPGRGLQGGAEACR